MMCENTKRLIIMLAALLALPIFIAIGIITSLVVILIGDRLDFEEVLEMWRDLGRLLVTGKMKWED